MIAGSERSSGEAGRFMPIDMCTMLIESSTVVACTPLRWWSFSVRAGPGRISACLPWTGCARAVALDVAVAADRRRAGAVAPEVAAEQEQVDDLADRVDAVLLLGDAEAPADDRAARLQVDPRDLADRGLVDS